MAAYPRAIPIAIFFLIAAITGLSIFAIERSERRSDEALLREQALAVTSALERQGATVSSYLRAGSALFATVDDMTPQIFDRFVGALSVKEEGGGSDGIGWAPRIAPNAVETFQAQYFEDTGRVMTIAPAATSPADPLFPVTFLRPRSERNNRAIGYNMASDPVRKRAIDRAIDTGNPVATGKLILRQEGDDQQSGFIIYMPVAANDRPGPRAKGLVYAPFNATRMLENAVKAEMIGTTGLRLYDKEVRPENLLAELAPGYNTGVTTSKIVTIADHEMVLVLESAHGTSLSRLSMATMLFGISLAYLLMLLSRLLARQTLEDERRFAWLEEQNSIRDSLTRELNHRVKNTLANVLSIMALTRRRSTSLDTFADSLDGRIRALSATHDLLTQSDWGTTPIRDLVAAELAPYAHQADTLLHLEGPDVEVAPNDALSLGLAIHELATNAAKYGSLSEAGGRVSVTWEKLEDDFAGLTWEESGGPVVDKPTRSGFGTNLIEKIVAHELRNPVDLQFHASGVVCKLKIPLRKPSDFAIRANSLD